MDLQLIAYAKMCNKKVVTSEDEQLQLPDKKYNYKIPVISKEQELKCMESVDIWWDIELVV